MHAFSSSSNHFVLINSSYSVIIHQNEIYLIGGIFYMSLIVHSIDLGLQATPSGT